ncbi:MULTISPECIES: SoxW family protein [Helicobacter]|uniref:Thioredoxin family protein n=1 Tax=Helicobacter ibis TaxID=2962633 RepID=A0ABT4VEF0_9HELI|nr:MULTISPECIES: thioredoxin family protein [Helicobacter]MDA3967480.1 thioredoxin family protein [Helicobacter sp. WB40]MDA3969079.1 thioredoxin family protein [Helicobacter ibis]
MKFIFVLIMAIFLFGCGDSVDSSVVSSGTKNTKEQLDAHNNIDKNSYIDVADVFLDTNKIITNNKPYFLVFAANGCIYCDKLKEIVKDDHEIKSILKNDFSPYYVNLSYSKMHQVDFLDSEISTAEFGKKYQVVPTPTLVFLNPKGEIMFVYPGYMPKDKFLATLNYIKDSTSKDESVIKNELQNIFKDMGV